MIEFFSNQAHFIIGESRYKVRAGVKGESTRWLVFRISKSRKYFQFKDEFFNDEALLMLQANDDKRLAVKGVLSPDGYRYWAKLTHFGIYHRKTGEVYNPKTQEVGFYDLRNGK